MREPEHDHRVQPNSVTMANPANFKTKKMVLRISDEPMMCKVAEPHTSGRNMLRMSSFRPMVKSSSVTPRLAIVSRAGLRSKRKTLRAKPPAFL